MFVWRRSPYHTSSSNLTRALPPKNDISCVLPRWIASAKTKSPPEILDIWYGDINKRQDVGRYMSEKAGRNLHFERNKEIAEVFRTLSNLHQSCPLLEMDQWKAYMFRIIAGRLTHLDFEIRNDPQTLNRLRKIPGIGSNSVDKIQEYLETGSLCRIEEFNSDSTRVAMKNMMSIWGVGRKTVRII
jgi:endonuclease III